VAIVVNSMLLATAVEVLTNVPFNQNEQKNQLSPVVGGMFTGVEQK